jgi:UPF0716 protein FxsA
LARFSGSGSRIGIPATFAIILATGMLGAGLTKSQGTRALRNFRAATADRRLPHAEMVDGILILIAGALLLTPGFLTDTLGFLMLVPAVRVRVRRRVVASLVKRFVPAGGVPASGPTPERRVDDRGGPVIDV